MKCVICKNGDVAPGKATVVLERGKRVIIFREVPADVCGQCGEYYLSEDVSAELFRRAETALRNGSEVEVLPYAA